MQQDHLYIAMEQQESYLDQFKNQNHNLLENDFQCTICNKVILSAHTTNCNNTFCEGFITKVG